MNLKIDKGIPIPNRYRGGIIKDIISKLKVGDSVLVETSKAASFVQQLSTNGMKGSRRKEFDTHSRVWRVK